VSRPFIEAAHAEHPSLLDPTHQLDALFGVVNIPNVIWIDEAGLIVRPAEPGWPAVQEYPESMKQMLADRARRAAEAAAASGSDSPPAGANLMRALQGGQDRGTYADAIRDWARNGAASQYVMAPDEVVAASQPRPIDGSSAAAHFELANHFWRNGQRAAAIRHFNECHRLQPDNWTYKRQAWSLVGNERAGGGDFGRFNQVPVPGEEANWPFTSDFEHDVAALVPGEYYPRTIHNPA
jgi:hypothetical protein